MGFLGRFSAPKARIELRLNEAVYTYTDRLTELISIDPLENIPCKNSDSSLLVTER